MRAKDSAIAALQVHYVGSFDDGTVFDSSRERDEPYEFVLGSTRVVPGFNDAVAGLGVGQSRRHTMAPADAYGAPPTIVWTAVVIGTATAEVLVDISRIGPGCDRFSSQQLRPA